jgi:hypothetical protein
LFEIIDNLGEEPPAYTLNRLKSLYVCLGGDKASLKKTLTAVPTFLTNYRVSFEDLTTHSGLTHMQLEDLRKIINTTSKAINKARARHSRLALTPEEATEVASNNEDAIIQQIAAEAKLNLKPISATRLKKAYPKFETSPAIKRSRARLRALKAVVGDQLACLMIEDNLSYLGEDHPGVVISGELPLTLEQKSLLRKELHKNRQLFYDRDRQKSKDSELEYLEDPRLQEATATMSAILLQQGLKIDAGTLIETDPSVLASDNVGRMRARTEALVEVCGKKRAVELLSHFPTFLATHRPVQALQESIDAETANALRKRINRLSDRERKKLARTT